jgi:hypothetical protein
MIYIEMPEVRTGVIRPLKDFRRWRFIRIGGAAE